jgi:hypothetical protein
MPLLNATQWYASKTFPELTSDKARGPTRWFCAFMSPHGAKAPL